MFNYRFLNILFFSFSMMEIDNLDEFVVDVDEKSTSSVWHVVGILVPSIFVSMCILALLLMYLIKHHNLRVYVITATARLVSGDNIRN